MALTIIITVLGTWAVLSLLGGEMQRQRQEMDLAREIEARRAARKAELAAKITEVREVKSPTARRSS